MNRPTSLERAFEMALSGEYASSAAIRLALKREGLNGSQIEGPRLIQQLNRMCREARGLDPLGAPEPKAAG